MYHSKSEILAMTLEDHNALDTLMMDVYDEHSAAHKYIFAFQVQGNYYMVTMDHIPREWCKGNFTSTKNGLKYKLNMRPNKEQKMALVASGICEPLDPSFRSCHRYKGWAFEKYLTEQIYNQEWHQDNTPFYEVGDIEVDGEQVQIKMEGAQIIVEYTLHNMGWI